MNKIKLIFTLLLLFSANNLTAASVGSLPFNTGSYQQLLDKHADQAFVLVLWSLTCSSCLEEMAMLKQVHQQYPELTLVMLAVDDIAQQNEINDMLANKGLADLESWIFADANTQRLRYQIDSAWYGEIPRLYFFDAQHQRQGYSGKMTREDFLSLLKK